MPTMDSATISGTPGTGLAKRLRPTTSALISTISAPIHSVPSAFIAPVTRCRPKGSAVP